MQAPREGLRADPAGHCFPSMTVSWLELQSASQPRLSYAEMAEDYPRYPDIHDLDLTLLNPRMIVVRRAPLACPTQSCPFVLLASQAASDTRVVSLQDVTPYMNPSPFTISPNTHVSQVFNLFRTMGLRHLPVVNAVGEVSGPCPAPTFEKGSPSQALFVHPGFSPEVKACHPEGRWPSTVALNPSQLLCAWDPFPCLPADGTSVLLAVLSCQSPTSPGLCLPPEMVFTPDHLFLIVGIITRHNLTYEFLQARLRQHYQTI
ncbi:hypothetical protein P7K49_015454 [Saguinus oedipus]|uniref:CBS domain-containing protein n=1 Tax=Saguinus oedipus TaxID=9490 RepID=A0ABQ9V9V5_SAGOE|nr:hypothetical protein P7K49_015454 [Saguinus oedipus]